MEESIFLGAGGDGHQQLRADSRHTSAVRRLTQREFCWQLEMSLCQDIPVRPTATQHHADTTLERLRGNHIPEKGQKRRDCRVCSSRGPGE